MRSVNTQTPSSAGPFHSGTEKHFLRILEDSSDDSPCLPIIPGAGDAPLLFNRPASTESDRSDQCDRPISGKGQTDYACKYVCACMCMRMYVCLYVVVYVSLCGCMIVCWHVCWCMVCLVVSALDCQLRGPGFKSRPGQKFGSRFLLHLRP